MNQLTSVAEEIFGDAGTRPYTVTWSLRNLEYALVAMFCSYGTPDPLTALGVALKLSRCHWCHCANDGAVWGEGVLSTHRKRPVAELAWASPPGLTEILYETGRKRSSRAMALAAIYTLEAPGSPEASLQVIVDWLVYHDTNLGISPLSYAILYNMWWCGTAGSPSSPYFSLAGGFALNTDAAALIINSALIACGQARLDRALYMSQPWFLGAVLQLYHKGITVYADFLGATKNNVLRTLPYIHPIIFNTDKAVRKTWESLTSLITEALNMGGPDTQETRALGTKEHRVSSTHGSIASSSRLALTEADYAVSYTTSYVAYPGPLSYILHGLSRESLPRLLCTLGWAAPSHPILIFSALAASRFDLASSMIELWDLPPLEGPFLLAVMKYNCPAADADLAEYHMFLGDARPSWRSALSLDTFKKFLRLYTIPELRRALADLPPPPASDPVPWRSKYVFSAARDMVEVPRESDDIQGTRPRTRGAIS